MWHVDNRLTHRANGVDGLHKLNELSRFGKCLDESCKHTGVGLGKQKWFFEYNIYTNLSHNIVG